MNRFLFIFTLVLTAHLAIAGQKPNAGAPPLPSNRVEVVLYSDFQCPYCAQFSQPFRELQTKGVDDVQTTVVFKNFPLSIHPNALLTHKAALAAKQQGKFWEMHDMLFANPGKVQRADLLGYAKKLGLDLKRFEKDMDSAELKKVIDADLAEGEKRGVNGTPTFFVNGKAYSGTRSFDQLKQIIVGDQRRARALADITDDLMAKGPADAPITLEFFADLESPVTRPTMDALNSLMSRYPKTVRLQFRNFPLSFHQLAPLVHEAAVTGALQGHFWEFVGFILDHQDSLREQDLIAYAGSLGMDETKFSEMLRKHQYSARVDADLESGLARGVRGSPVIFVNGKRIDGVPEMKVLVESVEAALATGSSVQLQKP